MDNQTVILRVQLDEGKTEEKLAKLVLDIEATRKAQQDLAKARTANKVTDEEFSQQTVKLTNQLTLQRAEQRNLTKDLDLYRTAQNGQVDGYKATQAALSLAIRQQQELAGSADNSSEASQALTKQIEQYRATLKATDEQQGAFFRNIGNYPKTDGLEKQVQQLVALQEQQKRYVMGSQEEIKARTEIGFRQQAAIQQAAKEGKSYEEATNFIQTYGEAIRPATADLIKLAEAQQQIAESGEATEEEVKRIGFQFGQAQKSIKDATDALKEVPVDAAGATQETKGLGGSLLEAAKSSDALGGTIDVLTSAKEKYAVAANIAKAATAGESAALGVLKLALIATGLGALVVVLGSVIAFLTKTQAGTDLLSRKMAAFGATVRVITNLVIDFGGKLVAAAQDPKQAFDDLVAFIETNVANRFKAIGVIIDAIRNRDFTKLTDGVVQLGTGITDATAKAKAFGQEIAAAATSAEAIERETQRIREAERALNVQRDESRAKIEGLKKASDDSTKSVAARTAAAKEAATIENGLLAEQLKLQDDKIANLKAGQALQKNLTTEDKDALADLRRARAQTAQESLTLQTELQNKINSLEQERIDKSIERRGQQLALDAALLNKQLAQVQVNSDKELSLRQQLLNKGRDAELNVKNLTVAQKKAIDVKYESDSLALTIDFNRRKLIASLTAQADLTAAALAGQQAGSDEALKLQAQQIEQQRKQAIAGLQANADNTAATAKINAQAAQQQRDLEYQQVAKALQDDIANRQRLLDNAYAAGLVKEAAYQEQKAVIAKIGTDAQTAINAKYLQDNMSNQDQANANERDAIQRHTDQVKQAEATKQEIRETTVQSFQAGTDAIISLFGEESAAGQAAVAFKKVLALAEIGINLQKTLSLNAVAAAELGAIPIIGPALAAAYLATKNTLAIVQAAVGAATVLALESGGIAHVGGGHVAQGLSHRQGGIPLYYRGRSAGIEIEGGEPVLTRGVSQNPLLLSLASTVNQLAGGRALVPGLAVPHMALGGVAPALVLDQLRGGVQQATAAAIGQEVARALRKVPPITRVVDIKTGLALDAETQRLSNS